MPESYQEKTAKLIRHHPAWRWIECIPGIITWLAFIVPILGSIFFPAVTATIIIIYTMIWFFRSFRMTFNLVKSYNLSQKALRTDWNRLLAYLENSKKLDYAIQKKSPQSKNCLEAKLKTQISELQKIGEFKKPSEIFHAVLYVTYKESYELIRESVKSYAQSSYDSKRLILVFGCEESDQENALKISQKIEKEFGKHFKKFLVTIHPKNIPGEIKGKSANATWAAKKLQIYLDENGIAYENIMLSNFDADTVVHRDYFSELTYKYLTTKNRVQMGYQPTHFFHNNIWDVPFFTRMIALGCTFWRMAESMEKDKYKSFSSRSLSFQMAVDCDFWDPAIIPEDSRQYWTAYLIYNGAHKLVPIYCPIYMDAVLSETYVKTFFSQYKQLRRWAWGVCDFPFVTINVWKHKQLDLKTKLYQTVDFVKNSFFWATGPILITFTGFLPGILNSDFRNTVLAYNLPHVMSNILTLASTGIIACAIISLKLVPYNKERGIFGSVILVAQWLVIPVISIILSAIPAIDAQTRLIFNKKLEYQVTQKSRK